MKRLEFSTEIDASPEKIWRVLWDDATYRAWTAAFSEGSHARTDGWKEGTTVHFLDPKEQGMYSRIEKHVPRQVMSFEHLGVVKNGEEQPQDEETKKWAGAREIYRLESNGNGQRLKVELDVTEDHADMFNDVFPRALKKVKELAES